MQKLYYTKEITINDTEILISYRETLPKFILDVMKKAHKNKMGISEYINYKGISNNSKLEQIINACFQGYREYMGSFSSNEELVLKIIEDGYVTREVSINGEIKSYLPHFNLMQVEFEGKSFTLNSKNEISEKALSIAKSLYPDAKNITLKEIIEKDEKLEEESIKLFLSVKGMQLNETNISLDSINIKDLLHENEISSDITKLSHTELIHGFQTLSINDYNEIRENWIQISKSDKLISYINIKEGNIELRKVYNWNQIPFFINKVVREYDFESGSDLYVNILEVFLNKNITLNTFIYKKFYLNEPDFRNKVVNNKEILSRLVNDKILLTKMLLHEDDFKLEDIKLPLNTLKKILINASNNQLPLMLSKIPLTTKEEIKDLKLLGKINNIDPSLLTKSQFEIIKDFKAKQVLMNEEYANIIGQLTLIGIRERVKKLTSKQKKNLKIDKRYVQWLNKTIGHNSGNTKITQGELTEARTNLEKAKKAIKL